MKWVGYLIRLLPISAISWFVFSWINISMHINFSVYAKLFAIGLAVIIFWCVIYSIEKSGLYLNTKISFKGIEWKISTAYSLLLTGILFDSTQALEIKNGFLNSGIFYPAILISIFFISQFLLGFRKYPAQIAAIHGLLVSIIINMSRWDQFDGKIVSQVLFSIFIALISGYFYTIYKNGSWKQYAKGKLPILVLLMITLFNALIIIYNKLRPEAKGSFNPVSVIAIFLVSCFLLTITEVCILDFLHKIQTKSDSQAVKNTGNIKTSTFWLSCFFIMGIIWGFYLIGAYPGVMTPDSLSQWNEAGGQFPLDNWFPVLYVFFIRLCRVFWDSPASVIIAQITIISAVFSSIFLFFYRNGLPAKFLLIIAALFAIFPGNGLMVVNLQKDALYGASFAWFTFILMKFLWEKEQFERNRLNLAGLFLSFLLTALLRHNGTILIFIFILIFAILCIIKRMWRVLGISVLAVISIIVIIGPIYTSLGVPQSQKKFLNINPIHDIATVIYDGGTTSEETYQMLIDIMPIEYWIKRFDRFSSDSYAFPNDGDPAYHDYLNSLEKISNKEVLILYLDTFLRSPLQMIGARLSGSSSVWNYSHLDGSFDTLKIYNPSIMLAWAKEWSVYDISWKENFITRIINAFVNFTGYQNPLLNYLFWCAGITNFIILVIMYYWLIKKKFRNFLVVIPYGLSSLILMISMTAQDYRYLWPHFITAMAIILFSVCREPAWDKTDSVDKQKPYVRPEIKFRGSFWFSLFYALLVTGIYSERTKLLEFINTIPGVILFYVGLFVAIFILSQILLGFQNDRPLILAIHGLLVSVIINSGQWDQLSGNFFSQVLFSVIIMLISGYGYSRFISGAWRQYLVGNVQLSVFVLMMLVSTAIIIYNKLRPELLVRFNPISVAAMSIMTFCLVSMTGICVLDIIRRLRYRIGSQGSGVPAWKNSLLFWMFSFIIMSTIWGIYLYGSYPGVMTPDSLSQWNEAVGVFKLDNWFPVFYVFFIRLCRLFWTSPASVIVAQIAIISAMFASIFSFFYRHGVSTKILYPLIFLFAVLPSNGIMVVNLQKDALFGASFVWLIFMVVKLVWEKEQFERNYLDLAGLFLSLLFTALLRHNGTILAYCFVVVLVFYCLLKKMWRVVVTAILALTAIIMISGPVYTSLGVPQSQKKFLSINPIHDIATVYYDGGRISDETYQLLIDIMPAEYWVERFNRYDAVTMFLYPIDGDPTRQPYLNNLNRVPIRRLLLLYADTFLKSPILLTEARMSGSSLIWDYIRLDGTYDTLKIYSPEIMLDWAHAWSVYDITWRENRVTKLINALANFTGYQNPILHSPIWCVGIANFFILLVVFDWFINKKYRYFLIAIPYFLSSLVLMLSITAPDFRFIWPHLLAAMVIVISAVIREPDRLTQTPQHVIAT